MNTHTLNLNFFTFFRSHWKFFATTTIVSFLLLTYLGKRFQVSSSNHSESLNIELTPPLIKNLQDFPSPTQSELTVYANNGRVLKEKIEDWAKNHAIEDLETQINFDATTSMFSISIKTKQSARLYQTHTEIEKELEQALNQRLTAQLNKVKKEKQTRTARMKVLENRKSLLEMHTKAANRTLLLIEIFQLEDNISSMKETLTDLEDSLSKAKVVPARAVTGGMGNYVARQKLNSTLFLAAAFFLSISTSFFLTLGFAFFQMTTRSKTV